MWHFVFRPWISSNGIWLGHRVSSKAMNPILGVCNVSTGDRKDWIKSTETFWQGDISFVKPHNL